MAHQRCEVRVSAVRLPAHPTAILLRSHSDTKDETGSALKMNVATSSEQQARGVGEGQSVDVICQQDSGD